MNPTKPEDFEEEPDSILKKVFVIVMAIFLILLVSSFIFFDYGTAEVIAGFFHSSTIDDEFSTQLNSGRQLIFTKGTYNELLTEYFRNQRVEFKACLQGEIIDNNFIIDEVVFPKIYSQTYNQVVSDQCQKETLVLLHSHPERRCIPSQQDINNFEAFKQINPDAIMSVMCERDRFYFVE